MTIARYDHIAIPISNVDAMLPFYRRLGFTIERFELDSFVFWAAQAGDVKINFHAPDTWKPGAFELRAPEALPGCGDICMVWNGTLATLTSFLLGLNFEIDTGPVQRTGGHKGGTAVGQSIYIRDPDRNLLEFIVYD